MPTDGAPILLYDGRCGLCARSVQFVLGHERRDRSLRFATLDGPIGEAARRTHPGLVGQDTVVWLEGTGDARRVLTRSTAVLRVLRYLGGPWGALAAVGGLVPGPLRDAAYRLVARSRYRVFGRDTACLLPSAAARPRFLDGLARAPVEIPTRDR